MFSEPEPADSFEHAGVWVEIVPDTDPAASPQDNDNAGTIYSWTRDFDGDESIGEPDLTVACPICDGDGTVPTQYWPDAEWTDCLRCEGDGLIPVDLNTWFATHYNAALTIPLQFQDWRSNGARLLTTDDRDSANCAICFTQKEIDYEWSGHLDPYPVEMKNADGSLTGEVREYGGARGYAEARIGELDDYFRGNVYGVVIRDAEDGEVLESVWGFIGDLFGESGKYIRDEAKDMAETEAETIAAEIAEAHRWACADVVTV